MAFWFRGPTPHESLWGRFRTSPDGFTATREDDYWMFHAVAEPGRTVEAFFALARQLPDEVAVVVRDAHTGTGWTGRGCRRGAVVEALSALRVALIAEGGVEITLFTEDDQITLNAVHEMFIYSHHERWVPLLRELAFEERRLVRTRSWGAQGALRAAPALSAAVAGAAATLGLVAA